MAYFARNPTFCSHRRLIASRHSPLEVSCELVDKIVDDGQLQSGLNPSVCDICCKWFEPSIDEWNPVVASLILNRADKLDDETKSMQLKNQAIESIPVGVDEPNGFIPSEQPPPADVTADQIESILPLPRKLESSKSQLVWMVGITTAVRRRPTLQHCIRSLKSSGWRQVNVFADGMQLEPLPLDLREVDVVSISRGRNVGAWSNFVLAAQELVHREPDADFYLMVQDDALLARFAGLREYAERLMQTIGSGSIASLYCCDLGTRSNQGWTRSRYPFLLGAQGIVFGREAMWKFVADPVTRPWEGSWHHNNARPLEQRGIDGNIGKWALQNSVPIWLPSPSLIWHLGETSTLWPTNAFLGIRRTTDFLEQYFRSSQATI